MTAVESVRPGTAENLARIAHFRALEETQPEELDAVAFFLLGPVGPATDQVALWEQLREPADQLWHLITEDWDDRDLDDLSFSDARKLPPGATAADEEQVRYELTRNRLVHDIEHTIWLARYRTAEIAAAMTRHPAGSGLAAR